MLVVSDVKRELGSIKYEPKSCLTKNYDSRKTRKKHHSPPSIKCCILVVRCFSLGGEYVINFHHLKTTGPQLLIIATRMLIYRHKSRKIIVHPMKLIKPDFFGLLLLLLRVFAPFLIFSCSELTSQ